MGKQAVCQASCILLGKTDSALFKFTHQKFNGLLPLSQICPLYVECLVADLSGFLFIAHPVRTHVLPDRNHDLPAFSGFEHTGFYQEPVVRLQAFVPFGGIRQIEFPQSAAFYDIRYRTQFFFA